MCSPYERGTAGPPFGGVLPPSRVLFDADERVPFLQHPATPPPGARNPTPSRGAEHAQTPRRPGSERGT